MPCQNKNPPHNNPGNQATHTKETNMTKKMFSIRDAKGEIYHPPFFKITNGEAERDFTTTVGDEKSMLNKYPEDFDLYYIGEFDDQTGKIESLETPLHMLKAVDTKNACDQRARQNTSTAN